MFYSLKVYTFLPILMHPSASKSIFLHRYVIFNDVNKYRPGIAHVRSETHSLIVSHLSICSLYPTRLDDYYRVDYSNILKRHCNDKWTQVIDPSPEPTGMTSFLAVSWPPDSCPDKTGEFLSVPIGSRKVRLETDWKITGIVRKHPTGIRRQRTSQKRLGNGRKRRIPAGSDTEIAETGRLFEVPATGLIDLGRSSRLKHSKGFLFDDAEPRRVLLS